MSTASPAHQTFQLFQKDIDERLLKVIEQLKQEALFAQLTLSRIAKEYIGNPVVREHLADYVACTNTFESKFDYKKNKFVPLSSVERIVRTNAIQLPSLETKSAPAKKKNYPSNRVHRRPQSYRTPLTLHFNDGTIKLLPTNPVRVQLANLIRANPAGMTFSVSPDNYVITVIHSDNPHRPYSLLNPLLENRSGIKAITATVD